MKPSSADARRALETIRQDTTAALRRLQEEIRTGEIRMEPVRVGRHLLTDLACSDMDVVAGLLRALSPGEDE